MQEVIVLNFEKTCPLCGSIRSTRRRARLNDDSFEESSRLNDDSFEESSFLQQKLENAERVIEELDQVIREQIKTIYDHVRKHRDSD